MKKTLLFSVMALALVFSSHAQNPQWRSVSKEKLETAPKVDRDSEPMAFELFHVDLAQLKNRLAQAPSRNTGVESNVIVEFPTPQGKLERFKIYEASVMHPDLASRYQEIQSYVGQSVDKPSETIRLTTTIFGLHVMASTENGTFYIDPYTQDLSNYIVYQKSMLKTTRTRECHVEENPENTMGLRMDAETSLASDSKFRTYRLAMACTIEYAAFHINAANLGSATLAEKKAGVLAAMNVTVARLNQVYERDMSLTLQLVPNNDIIIFVTSDTFNNTNATVLIGQSQSVIDANIGSANYDVGHTVSTGGGGLASLGSVCINGSKARGITGSPAPVGDPFDIDFVAHEVGHQFGGSHTFNGVTSADIGNCTTSTRSNSTAVEPGSGSTIMAYAGICGPQDVQTNSDSHFHAVSIAQMVAHITGAGNCVAGVSNGNAAPVANAGSDYTIPKGTPFILKGSATDANNPNTLTYCWEQTDTQISTQPPLSSNASGPNYRSFPPTSSPDRWMPRKADVLEGNLTPKWEVTPSVARTMNFALTARDNAASNGGQTHRDDMTVTVNGTAGPFRVTFPDQTNINLAPSSSQTITWDVAGTTGNGVNTANVNILISTDNGATFTTLVANTPNDGSQAVILPATPAPFCRIMVESVGNIFYAMSKSFAMGYNVEVTCESYTASPGNTITIGPTGPQWFIMGNIVATSAATITDMNVNLNITHTNINDLYIGVLPPGPAEVGQIKMLYQQGCASGANMNVDFDDQGATLNCGALNAGNAYQPLAPLSVFNGTAPNQNGGSWRIVIADVAAADNGTLNSFTFEFCSTTATLATEDFGLSNFVLYPNPNNGSFNVSFDSASTNDIAIGIHDLRGRKVFDKSYQNTGTFVQNVQTEGLQAGVYIVTVQDGEKKAVKRIVVE